MPIWGLNIGMWEQGINLEAHVVVVVVDMISWHCQLYMPSAAPATAVGANPLPLPDAELLNREPNKKGRLQTEITKKL